MNTAFVEHGEGECGICYHREDSSPITIMAGQRGAPGKSGAGASSTYTWNQATALSVWTIPHNLDRFPSVTITDLLGQRVEPDVKYVSSDIIQITHGIPFAGVAYLN